MDTFLQKKEEKKGISKVFLVGVLFGAAVIGSVIWLLTFQPTAEEQKAKMMEGFFLEGTPEFDKLTKDIVISTDFERTTESPTGLGTIQMTIRGKIRNKGEKTLNGLEVSVGVIDTKKNLLKEKKVLFVPNQQPTLEPQQILPVTVAVDGFSPEDERANVRWKVTAIKTQ
ncbi:MAG: hypothetical protein JWN60_1979 [Acidobacteria bacterium]|jgi:hypothetical protein|nr:hypothetical protein [Acidobacteriota bacterium]